MEVTKTQQALLTCCLTDDKETFMNAWRYWKKEQIFEELDTESNELIPFLLQKIDAFKIIDENTPRYRGIVKKNWVRTQNRIGIIHEIQKLIGEKSCRIQSFPSNNRAAVSILVLKNEKDNIIQHLLRSNYKLNKNHSFYQKLRRHYYTELNTPKNETLRLYWSTTRIPHRLNFHVEVFDLTDTYTFYLLLLNAQTTNYTSTFAWIVACLHHLRNKEFNFDKQKFIQLVQENESSLFILDALRLLSTFDTVKQVEEIIVQLEKQSNPSWLNSLEYHLLKSSKKWMRYFYFLVIHPIKTRKLSTK